MSVSVTDEDNLEFRSNVLNAHAVKELTRKFIVTGENNWLKSWEMIIMLLVLWQALYVPFLLAFDPNRGKGLWTFDKAVDLIFIIDFMSQFNIARKNDEGILPKNRYEVAVAYVKSGTPSGAWFLIDLTASFPFDWLITGFVDSWDFETYMNTRKNNTLLSADLGSERRGGGGDAVATAKLAKVLRLPRLLRVLKVRRQSRTTLYFLCIILLPILQTSRRFAILTLIADFSTLERLQEI